MARGAVGSGLTPGSPLGTKTKFKFGGLEFDCYFGWNKPEQHGTFSKWFQYLSMKSWHRNGIPIIPNQAPGPSKVEKFGRQVQS